MDRYPLQFFKRKHQDHSEQYTTNRKRFKGYSSNSEPGSSRNPISLSDDDVYVKGSDSYDNPRSSRKTALSTDRSIRGGELSIEEDSDFNSVELESSFSEEESDPLRYNIELELLQAKVSANVLPVRSDIINKSSKISSHLQGKDQYYRIWTLLRRHPLKTSAVKSLSIGPSSRLNRKVYSDRAYLSGSQSMFGCFLNASKLRVSSSYKKMAGALTAISQSNDYIACSSATPGGDDESSGLDLYNRNGALIVWRGNDYTMIDSHSSLRKVESGEQQKYYTVNSVTFDPLRPNILISTGNDRYMRVHKILKKKDGRGIRAKPVYKVRYPGVPYHTAFKPQSSTLAVGCSDGKLYVYDSAYKHCYHVLDPNQRTNPGNFLWGLGIQSDLIFASTETDNYSIRCYHSAIDATSMLEVFNFSTKESGDSMAINPSGDVLALVTNVADEHTLSLYDIRSRDGRTPISSQFLRKHSRDDEVLEVSCAAFSPDGNLLALGRSDNEIDVYDVRFLDEKNIWARLKHPWRPLVERGTRDDYGCQGLYWVQGISGGGNWAKERYGNGSRLGKAFGGGSGLGLVTGASDGCIRLWDVSRAPMTHEESMILYEADHDISQFAIGDPTDSTRRKEKKMIVGDCGGEVHFLD